MKVNKIRMDIGEDIKILINLRKYLNLLIHSGQHKIFYNDLGWDEKTIDCINAIDHILAAREEDKKRIKELEEKSIDIAETLYKERMANAVMSNNINGYQEALENSISKDLLKEELERAKKENEPYEEYEIESRMYWINQGKISLAKKLLEDKMLKEKELEYSDFNTYPHYVFATAFLVNGELADYKIQNRERNWGNRTFRGSDWENEVWEKGFITKELDLTCEYKKILVNNSEEHNEAFEKLEDWLFTNFKIYQKANPVRW